MAEKFLRQMPEVFVSTADKAVAVSRAVKSGHLRKLASRLYTKNLADAPTNIIKHNLWQIVGAYFPGALVADRTALENVPAKDGSVCLITESGQNIILPGIVLRPRRGVGPLPTDLLFIGGLYISSTARAFLENMRLSRTRNRLLPRTLSQREIEERLEKLIRMSGTNTVNQLRDEVHRLSPTLHLEAELQAFDKLVGALLGTSDLPLFSQGAKARKAGYAYDPDRLTLFQTLYAALKDTPPLIRLSPHRTAEAIATLTFYEAYFSNFIEGTEFEVSEAANIVFKNMIPMERPADAHDVLGTWKIVSSSYEMQQIPTSYNALLHTLRAHHTTIMGERIDKTPGKFKQASNRAGLTTFVAPDLVEGTLKIGFELYQSLEVPFQRAVFMMFLISEVHPFADGNGRMARIMMNAELVKAGEERIIIPTIYRSNYIVALKALSQTGYPEALIRVLDFAQKWTAAVDWGDLKETKKILDRCNAFLDSAVADKEGKRLLTPGRENFGCF